MADFEPTTDATSHDMHFSKGSVPATVQVAGDLEAGDQIVVTELSGTTELGAATDADGDIILSLDRLNFSIYAPISIRLTKDATTNPVGAKSI